MSSPCCHESEEESRRNGRTLHASGSLISPVMTGYSGGPAGSPLGTKRGKKRVGEVPAEGAELHPKVPTSKEECAITISRGERDRRSKVE